MSSEIPAVQTNPVSQSGSKLLIESRRVKFDLQEFDTPFYYRSNGPISAIWAALSASFPAGEAEFIHSVSLFKNKVSDPKLLAEIKSFTAQEAHHSLQHKQLNKFFDKHGYRTQKIDEYFQQKIDRRVASWSPERRLARTVVAEHVTAVMAHYALTNSKAMSYFPSSIRNLFQWHAIEEIEHKSVAFDVYQHCVGDQQLLRKEFRYFSYFEFPKNVLMSARFLLKQMGHRSSWQERKQTWRYLFGDGGLISSQKPMYMMFLKEGFHPWNHDNSALVEEWKLKLSPHFVN